MATDHLLQKVHSIGDIELAVLLCLVCHEHCIISTEAEALDQLVEELQMIASHTFGLRAAVVHCDAHTTLDDFAAAIQLLAASSSPELACSPEHRHSLRHGHHLTPADVGSNSRRNSHQDSMQHASATGLSTGNHEVVNVVIARQLGRAPQVVQIQALEMIRNGVTSADTRGGGEGEGGGLRSPATPVASPPSPFLLIAALAAPSAGRARLTRHLNDRMFLSHWHDPADGFIYLDTSPTDARATTTPTQPQAAASFLPQLVPTNSIPPDRETHVRRPRSRQSATNDNVEKVKDDAKRHSRRSSCSSNSSSSSIVRMPQPDNKRASRPSLAASLGSHSFTRAVAAGRAASATQPALRSPTLHTSPPLSSSHPVRAPATPTSADTARSNAALFSAADIANLARQTAAVAVDMDVTRYQMNVTAFLRLHHAVADGSCVSPLATRHFLLLARALAPLHAIDFVTPSLVVLAARKIYVHRVVVLAPPTESMAAVTDCNSDNIDNDGDNIYNHGTRKARTKRPDDWVLGERSLQWGGDATVVKRMLQNVEPEDVVEDVLNQVTVPI